MEAPHQHPRYNPSPNLSLTPRQTALLLHLFPSLFASVAQPPSSSAISFGISGPKEWLIDQKKKAAKFMLAPIHASCESLQSKYLLLTREREIESSPPIPTLMMEIN